MSDRTIYVTDHFRWDEFRCNDGTPVPGDLRILVSVLCSDLLEPLRAIWDRPVTILSGYRTKSWNRRIGGAEKSEHLIARAADIVVSDISASDVYREVDRRMIDGTLRAGGLGRYDNFVHVDIGRPRRWAVPGGRAPLASVKRL